MDERKKTYYRLLAEVITTVVAAVLLLTLGGKVLGILMPFLIAFILAWELKPLSRRLQSRVKGEAGRKYFAHTLNNTCVAPPRMLIAFLENNLQKDGRVHIPEALRMYMGGKEFIG